MAEARSKRVTQAGLARAMGVSRAAVTKALASGRITAGADYMSFAHLTMRAAPLRVPRLQALGCPIWIHPRDIPASSTNKSRGSEVEASSPSCGPKIHRRGTA